MKILLASPHRYPAFGKNGSGLHPKRYPSGSGYHVHDLLAKGLLEEGHEVFYYLKKGAESPLPHGVNLVSEPIFDVDLCHAPLGPSPFPESIMKPALDRRKPWLLTCHARETNRIVQANWIFVSHALARAHSAHRAVLNGIDSGDYIFSESKEDYFLFISAMDRATDKGLNLALSLRRIKGFRLIVAGTALDYQTIQCVSELCSAAGVEYVGDVRGTRKAELLAGARAVLFPSRLNEGCPLTILEAMMSGTPVISSRKGGTVEVVTAETGFLCDGDEDWSGAVDRLGEVSPKRCREIALQKFHYRRMVKDYLHEYRWELERSDSSSSQTRR